MIKILEYEKTPFNQVFSRVTPKVNVEKIVFDIIEKVKTEGDEALKEYTEKFDGAVLDSLEVTEQEIKDAVAQIEPEFLRILRLAKENITEFHLKQKREGFKIEKKNGVVIGQKITPVEKAGLYVPGGTASYPSTVLMDAIPAKIAGCKQVVMVTPPNKDGRINPLDLLRVQKTILGDAYISQQ